MEQLKSTYKLYFNSQLKFSCVNSTSSSISVLEQILERFDYSKIRSVYITKTSKNGTEIIFKNSNEQKSRKVLDKETELQFDSSRDASIATGLSVTKIINQCRKGKSKKNRFNYI